jgi:hypothetical protein
MVCIGTLNSHRRPTCRSKPDTDEEPVERHSFNRLPDALKPSGPGPPPTCPFIIPTMRKSQPPNWHKIPSPFPERGFSASLAVNDACITAAPPTRGDLRSPMAGVNTVRRIIVKNGASGNKTYRARHRAVRRPSLACAIRTGSMFPRTAGHKGLAPEAPPLHAGAPL